jgi:hypothetical protein
MGAEIHVWRVRYLSFQQKNPPIEAEITYRRESRRFSNNVSLKLSAGLLSVHIHL